MWRLLFWAGAWIDGDFFVPQAKEDYEREERRREMREKSGETSWMLPSVSKRIASDDEVSNSGDLRVAVRDVKPFCKVCSGHKGRLGRKLSLACRSDVGKIAIQYTVRIWVKGFLHSMPTLCPTGYNPEKEIQEG